MAKYGMSMCVLGMSEEFKQYNIGVNALWPKTGMYSLNHHYFSIFFTNTFLIWLSLEI